MQLVNGLGGASGFGEQLIPRNDDSYASNINITGVFGAQGLKFFGTSYTTISINNNGNITFGGTGLSSYTPWAMQTNNGKPMIAAFFADVDTRGYSSYVNGPNAVPRTPGGTSTGSNLVWYDFNAAAANGHGVLTITWDDVGYYSSHTDKLNAFQMRLIGTGGGNFDIEFRYENISWTTGSASGGTNGLGGTIARGGFTAGDGVNYFELDQSGIQDQMLTLENILGNTGLAGYYYFSSRSGGAGNDTIYGDGRPNVLSGGDGIDTIYGLGGNDQLDGSTGNDVDTMYGGLGDDTFVVRDSGDRVIELFNQGNDTVQTSLSYSLAAVANVENIHLTGTGSVNATGNGLNNTLISNAGSNILNGAGGSDTASFELSSSAVNASLVTNIATGQGTDRLVSIENLTGSIYNDTLTGNAGANVLDGLNGIDTMRGGNGNDTYYVRNVGDAAIETTPGAPGGVDTVFSSISAYTLGANIENGHIMLTSAANMTGNGLNNIIYAGAGNNVMNGSSGIDTLSYAHGVAGATGVNVNLALTVAQATSGSGTDTILGFENLTGSSRADTLRGNSAHNVITGGAGNDVLYGNGGNDTFDFNAISETGATATLHDTIMDFLHGDKIDLSTIDANTATAINDAFSGVLVSTFTHAGQLKFSGGILYGNTDADAAAEFAIKVVGVASLSVVDFVL